MKHTKSDCSSHDLILAGSGVQCGNCLAFDDYQRPSTIYPTFDDRDLEILNSRQEAFLARKQVKQGDFIHFPDGTLRRVSHVWVDENNNPSDIQTSDGGSFYLGDGYMSFSGSLFSSVRVSTLEKTDKFIDGSAWFFHHDWHGRDNAVYVNVQCPVWFCPAEPPQ